MRYVTFGVTIMAIVIICSGHNVEGPPRPPTMRNQGTYQDPSATPRDTHALPLMLARDVFDVHEDFQVGNRHNLVEIQKEKLPDGSYDILTEGFSTNEGSNEELTGHELEGILLEPLWSAFHTQVLDTDFDEGQSNKINKYILKHLWKYYLPDIDLINNTDCKTDLEVLFNATTREELFSVAMLVDSWGKFPDGFFAGNVQTFGSFDECIKIDFLREEEHPSKGSLRGQYCTLQYMPTNSTKEMGSMSNMASFINRIHALSPFYMYGTCMPSTCTHEDLRVSVTQHLTRLNLTIRDILCQTSDETLFEFNAGGITMIVLLSLGGILILGSGILDAWIYYTEKDELRKGPLKYLLAFSIYTNLEKMFRINTSGSRETINCIHGMRVLSMTWVVYGHQYAFTTEVNANEFLLRDKFNDNMAIQIVMNAFPSVDTFFFLTGFLVTYVVFKEQDRSGKFNIIPFYIHRFLRISPPIMLLCGFLATFERLLVRGPLAPAINTILMENCQKHWYRDSFYMTNFNTDERACLWVTWYTSVDTQLYLVTPIFLLPFIVKQISEIKVFKRIDIGAVWLAILTLVSVIIPLIIITTNRLPPGSVHAKTEDEDDGYELKVYGKPWCRASPFLVGIWLAYIMRHTNKEKKKIHLQLWQVMLGWVLAFAIGIAVVFGLYNYNQLGAYVEYNWAFSAFYGSLQRLLWAVAVAWVVFACHNGYGGPVNTFLSHPSWQPLSRLTYCIFLVAMPIQQMVFVFSIVVLPYFSHLHKIIEAVGVLFLAGIGGIILSLYTEGPILGLERHLLKK